MTAQSIYSKGPRQQSQARNLISNVAPAPLSIRQTVERYSDQDVFSEENVILVRSKFSAHRYFQVLGTACSCEVENCPHVAKANAFRAANAEVVEEVKQPSPSQARKMVPVDSAEKVIVQGEAILVQSRRFIGWAYTVTWNDNQARYICSCGNPVCKEHVGAVKEYASAQHASKLAAAPEKKDILGTVEWFRDQDVQYEAALEAVRAEKALVAQIRDEFARTYIDAIAANINLRAKKTLVRRGIFALSQKSVA